MGIFRQHHLWLGTVAIVAMAAPAVAAQTKAFNVPAQAAVTGIPELARQADVQILVGDSLVRGVSIKAVKGVMTVEAALRKALGGTGLKAASSDGRTYIIAAPQVSLPEEDRSAEDIIVTGTRIRGAAPVGGQVETVDRKVIEQRGYTTVQDALRTLSQASGMGAVETGRPIDVQNSNLNFGRGTGVNLRGLGADATLVLLNGRRLAPSGAGGFVDISLIPLVAIERVEVLPDGASAVYGSDAVGGVVDLVTKKRIHGFKVEADAGQGNDLWNARGAVATGLNWATGSIVATGEYRYSSRLKTIDRSYARRDLSAVGGTDQRTTTCTPGTLTAGSVTYAIPSGQNGVGLAPGSLVRGTSNICDIALASDILPKVKRWSTTAHAEQELATGLSLFADALYSHRHSVIAATGPVSTVTVPRTNPFFVNVNPAVATETVAYNFANDIGVYTPDYRANSLSAVGGANYAFSPTWNLTSFYSYARARDRVDNVNQLNTFYLARFIASSDPIIAFNPFGQGGTNPLATVNAIRGYSTTETEAVQQVFNIGVDGALFDPFDAGPIKVAFGGEYLRQRYVQESVNYLSTAAPVIRAPTEFRRSDKALYAEMVVPVVGGRTALPLVKSLTFSAAVRRDDYNDFGSTVNPRLGADWMPVRGIHINGAWGKSFKAPILSQLTPLYASAVYVLADPQSPTGTSNVVGINRGDRPLKAESARTFSIGAKYADSSTTPLTLSVSYFDIFYRNRIQSAVAVLGSLLSDPINAARVIRNPTAAQISAIQNDPNNTLTFAIPPGGIGAIADFGDRNVATLQVRGLDASIGYSWPIPIGRFGIEANVTRMLDYKTANTTGAPVVEQVGTLGYPNKWKAVGAFSLTGEGYNVTLNANYVGSYRNTAITPTQRVKSWTTFDLTGQVQLESFGFGHDVTLVASLRNLANRRPPVVYNVFLGYDSYTANALGRVASLGLRGSF